MILSITLYIECLYAECRYADCRDLFIVMLNVVMLCVVMLNVAAPLQGMVVKVFISRTFDLGNSHRY